MKPTLSAVIAFFATATSLLSQANLTWNGATNNNWSTAPADVNWTGSPWTNGNNAVFNNGTYNVTVVGAITAANLLLDNAPTTTSPTSLTLTGAGSSLTVNGAAVLNLGPFQTGNTVVQHNVCKSS